MKIEQKEALMRIVIGIVTGIILHLWRVLIAVIAFVHFFYVLFTGKRHKGMAEFCHIFNDQLYKYAKYMTFATNKRVFPFADLGKQVDKPDFKKNPE